MNRLFALFFLSFLFAFFLSPVFGQLELGNDTFQLKMMQNVRNSVDYVKPESDWGKSRSYNDVKIKNEDLLSLSQHVLLTMVSGKIMYQKSEFSLQ